jgi:hypothetical protein
MERPSNGPTELYRHFSDAAKCEADRAAVIQQKLNRPRSRSRILQIVAKMDRPKSPSLAHKSKVGG